MKRPNTTTVLLAVVAVLLGVNLLPKADAGENGPAPAPYIVKQLVITPVTYYRVWSDGRVDVMGGTGAACEFDVVTSYGPVEHPFPVVDAQFSEERSGCVNDCALKLTYGDGRVDMAGYGVASGRCTIAGIGTPSLCIGDVDRNGIVGIEDFLTVLAQWGEPCQ